MSSQPGAEAEAKCRSRDGNPSKFQKRKEDKADWMTTTQGPPLLPSAFLSCRLSHLSSSSLHLLPAALRSPSSSSLALPQAVGVTMNVYATSRSRDKAPPTKKRCVFYRLTTALTPRSLSHPPFFRKYDREVILRALEVCRCPFLTHRTFADAVALGLTTHRS